MSFSEIKGHKAQIDLLVSSHQNNRIAQSYLFIGRRGIGKSRVAKEFVKFLNCQENNNISCCDKCISCSKVERFLHPDILYLGSNNDESIKIEQIRNLKWFFSLAPFEADYKIAVIDGADYLTVEASNSLLKILEEPSKKAILILIATAEDKLLPTVVSRCQIIRFQGLPPDALRSILYSDYNFAQEDLQVYLNYSNGSLGSALKLKEADFMSLRENIISDFLLRRRPDAMRNQLLNTSNSQELKRVIFILLTLLRDSCILKSSSMQEYLMNADYCREIEEFYRYKTSDEVLSILERIIEIYNLIDKNTNKRLIVESILSHITPDAALLRN